MITATEKIDKKKAILRTTLKLISSNGFHAAPMSAIAKEAGIAAGTIYLYFENKEDLIIQLYKHVKAELAAYIPIPDPQLHYKLRTQTIWQQIFDFFRQYPEKYRFLEQYEESPFISNELSAEVNQNYLPLQLFFQQGIEQGFFRNIGAPILTVLLLQSVSTAYKIFGNEAEIDNAKIEVIFKSFWDGIKID